MNGGAESLIALAALFAALAALGLVVALWRRQDEVRERHEMHRETAGEHETRLRVLELRLSMLDEIERRQDEQGEMLSKLVERTGTTLEMVVSIQRFLMNGGRSA